MLFLRICQHLLPTGEAWSTTVDKTLRRLFVGLSGVGADVKQFADDAYLDLFPETTRELAEWEQFFGLPPNSDEATARMALAAEWRSAGGQSKSYIEGVLHTAGFNVWLHEWWDENDELRDPHDYTESSLLGTMQCGEPWALCGEPDALANGFAVNDPNYFVNLNLSPLGQRPIPTDPAYWPFFIYVGGETFPDRAEVGISRKLEFQRLIQKLKPAQHWIVLLVDYVPDDTWVDELGDPIVDESGDTILV